MYGQESLAPSRFIYMSEFAPNPNADVWIVIAAYNEGGRLAKTLADVMRHFENVVVVDDGSSDETGGVALRHRVWLLRHIFNCGQGAALQTGIDFAVARGADIVVTFDADGQHDAREVQKLLTPIREGRVDVALGSRFLGQAVDMPLGRWALLKAAVVFTRIFSRLEVTDTHNGLRALSRRAAQSIRIYQDRMAHASEILDQIRQHRLRFEEIPTTVRYTQETLAKGQSSWNAIRIMSKLLLDRFVK